MKVKPLNSYFYSKDGVTIATLFASTPVSLLSQLKSIQANERCDIECLNVCVVTPERKDCIRLWRESYGNVLRYNWRIDDYDFKVLSGVPLAEAEARYYDSVIG